MENTWTNFLTQMEKSKSSSISHASHQQHEKKNEMWIFPEFMYLI